MYFVLTRKIAGGAVHYRTRHGDLTEHLWEAQIFQFEVRGGRPFISPILPDGEWHPVQVHYEVVKPPRIVHMLLDEDEPGGGQAVS